MLYYQELLDLLITSTLRSSRAATTTGSASIPEMVLSAANSNNNLTVEFSLIINITKEAAGNVQETQPIPTEQQTLVAASDAKDERERQALPPRPPPPCTKGTTDRQAFHPAPPPPCNRPRPPGGRCPCGHDETHVLRPVEYEAPSCCELAAMQEVTNVR